MFPVPAEPQCDVCGCPASAANLYRTLGGLLCVNATACILRVIEIDKFLAARTENGADKDTTLPGHDLSAS